MLYTKDKSNRVRTWDCQVIEKDGKVHIVKTYGLMDGKKTVNTTVIESGKNIGKKNETSVLTQAQLIVESLTKKQLDSGYTRSLKELENKLFILPMLANKWSEKSHYISKPFVTQPKLDGVRMIVGRHPDTKEIMMLSRTGKQVLHLDHIREEIEHILGPGDFFDGENFSPTLTFEEIVGLCRKTLDAEYSNITSIKFHVFDYFNLNKMDESFEERRRVLDFVFTKKNLKNIIRVPTKTCSSPEDMLVHHKFYIENNYEGTMIRDLNGKYLLNERSNHLLKFKDFQTEEYRIIDAQEATGKDAGTVVWVCETKDGLKFNVRPKGTLEKRRMWLKTSEDYYGKLLTVQFQNLSNSGIPRFPVGLVIRDYE